MTDRNGQPEPIAALDGINVGDWLRGEHVVAEVVEVYDAHGHTPDGPAVYPMMKLRTVLLEVKSHRCHECGARWPKRIGLPDKPDDSVHPPRSPLWIKLTDRQRKNAQQKLPGE